MNAEVFQRILPEEIIGEKLISMLSLPENYSRSNRISLSGIPGSGKTTMAHLVADHLKGMYLREFLEPLPPFVLDMRGDSSEEQQVAAQRWIISQYKAKVELIQGLPENMIVVQDRGVIDGLVYSAVCKAGVLEIIRKDCETIAWTPILNIILIADDLSVKARMTAREQFTEEFFNNSWLKYIQDLRNKYIAASNELKSPLIDTSNKSTEDVLQEILSLL